MTEKRTLASLQSQIDELKREVQKLKDKNQRELEKYTEAVQRGRGEVIR
jgi:gas vesicle protein